MLERILEELTGEKIATIRYEMSCESLNRRPKDSLMGESYSLVYFEVKKECACVVNTWQVASHFGLVYLYKVQWTHLRQKLFFKCQDEMETLYGIHIATCGLRREDTWSFYTCCALENEALEAFIKSCE